MLFVSSYPDSNLTCNPSRCLSANACYETTATQQKKASIKTFRFSDLLSATMGTSPFKKKRRNRSLYAISVLFLLAYFTISASRTKHAQVTGREGGVPENSLSYHATYSLSFMSRGFCHQTYAKRCYFTFHPSVSMAPWPQSPLPDAQTLSYLA